MTGSVKLGIEEVPFTLVRSDRRTLGITVKHLVQTTKEVGLMAE